MNTEKQEQNKQNIPSQQKFSKAEFAKLAKLSRLHIHSADEDRLLSDISKIRILLDEVVTFDKKSLSALSGDSHVFDVLRFEKDAPVQKSPVRKDILRPGQPIAETEKLAPEFTMRHFIVPQVIDGE